MLDRPVHIQQYRELNVVMSFVRLASTKASSLWRYIFMTKYDKTENCGIIFRGYAVVWKWRQSIKYLDMKAKTFWKFSKCILFQSSTFHLKIEVVTFWDICMISVDTRSWLTNIWRRVSRLTAPRLGKSFFQKVRDSMLCWTAPGGGQGESDVVEGVVGHWPRCWGGQNRCHLWNEQDQLTEEHPIIPHLASDEASEGGLALGLGERGDHIAGQLASKFAHHSRIGSASEEGLTCTSSWKCQIVAQNKYFQFIHAW